MRSMGHVEKTAAFRQRRAAETARWRERLQRGAGVEISVVSFARLAPPSFTPTRSTGHQRSAGQTRGG